MKRGKVGVVFIAHWSFTMARFSSDGVPRYDPRNDVLVLSDAQCTKANRIRL